MKLIYAVWEDISEQGETWEARDAPSPDALLFEQVGWLVEHTANEVVLTACVGKELIGARTRIPLGIVRTMIELDPAAGAPLPIRTKRKARPTP